MDAKQALGIAFPLSAFYHALVRQKGGGLGEEHAKRAQGCIFHPIAGVFARAFYPVARTVAGEKH